MADLLDAYRLWRVSPVALLEIQFLDEVGRLEVEQPEFSRAVASDSRFVVDEAPLAPLVEKALPLSWTRDPFDPLLAAHAEARQVPLCSLDRRVRSNHRRLVRELGA